MPARRTERPDVTYDAAIVLGEPVDPAASRVSGDIELPAEAFWGKPFVLPDVERVGWGTASSTTADSTAAAPRSS